MCHAMKSTFLFILLASVLVCNFMTVCRGQSISAEEEPDQRTMDDLLHHSAESLLLRSILRKMQGEDHRSAGLISQPEWVTKRQHPGKRYGEDLEKEDDGDEEYWLGVDKRQHPGKREEVTHSLMELQKRQHPGRRSTTGHLSDHPVIVVGGLSKRQHPGKRYLVVRSRRQHPGKRQEEEEEGDEEEEEEDLPEVDKRQHPGKRFWDHSDPDLSAVSPCEDVLDLNRCARTNLLLDFLDKIRVKHAEEKRQHPGKRFAPERDLVDAE
ncbi:pro-thyrotropin-releasing hormone [Entelurus aequoreus]|uniref:pro-thyrotropin-releasing hormone n=1 Tax=Entelurus aequoreus TaxID=161455 RepID=UPI002B1DD6B6|nr:pro-thyrotropin-releasing hormone [Entelurus aequoreus]